MPGQVKQDDVQSRLLTVESHVYALFGQMKQLTDVVGNMSKDMRTAVDSQSQQINQLTIAVSTAAVASKAPRETNWFLIASGLTLVGAFWASQIKPIQTDIDRQTANAGSIASAVLLQNEKIQSLQLVTKENEIYRKFHEDQINRYAVSGSPGADKRLSVLEKESADAKSDSALRVFQELIKGRKP